MSAAMIRLALMKTNFILIFTISTSCQGNVRVETYNRCSQVNKETSIGKNCSDLAICKKAFNISYIEMPPYTPSKEVERHLRLCCGNCTTISVVNTFTNISQVHQELIKSSHFMYPFLGSVTDKLVNGYYFIPVMHVPEALYLTLRQEITLFHSIFHLFPFLTICLLMAAVAGFVCWVAETRSNSKEFPSSFLQGWFQGFWWSVASMTTVGYGDKVPRTVFGRLFGVVWIFAGITVTALLAAMVTSTTIDANNPKPPSFIAKKVGILKYRTYDALVLAHFGGIKHEAESPDFESSIYELAMKVVNHTDHVDGLMLDSYTLWYILQTFTSSNDSHVLSKDKRDNVVDIIRDMVITSTEYTREALSYGILVKEETDYEFLNDVVRSHRFALQSKWDHRWNYLSRQFFHHHKPRIFDSGRPYFQMALIFLVGGIVVICMIGFGYEFLRSKRRNETKMRNGINKETQNQTEFAMQNGKKEKGIANGKGLLTYRPNMLKLLE